MPPRQTVLLLLGLVVPLLLLVWHSRSSPTGVKSFFDPELVDLPSSSSSTTCSLELSPELLARLPGAKSSFPVSPSGYIGSTPGETHPVLQLIHSHSASFRSKLEGQSTSYAAAVLEYQRRFSRDPPDGFDRWWAFVEEHSVLFPDEHPSTSLLEPFYSLSPSERRARLARASTEPERGSYKGSKRQSLVVVKHDDSGLGWEPLADPSLPSSSSTKPPKKISKRTRAHLALLAPIAHLLPPFRAVLNNADQPVVLLDPKIPGELEDPEERSSRRMDWKGICARRQVTAGGKEHDPWSEEESAGEEVAEEQAEGAGGGRVGFVDDSVKAGDVCLNPSILKTHGFYLQNSPSSPNPLALTHRQLIPILSLASTSLHSDILVPAVGVEGKLQRADLEESEWGQKREGVWWRGSATGMQNTRTNEGWEHSHRLRLSSLSNSNPGLTTPEKVLGVDAQGRGVWERKEWKRWLDVHLASGWGWKWFKWWPELGQQCDYWDGSCEKLGTKFHYAPKSPPSTSSLYKFLLDVDGNSWSARFPSLMQTNSLVLKNTVFREWNDAWGVGWVGFVPLGTGFDELGSLESFFHPSDPELAGLMDDLAREMAQVGKCWKERTWRVVDMQAYVLRLYLEWARLFNED